MNKRNNRVYWLMAIVVIILFFSFIIGTISRVRNSNKRKMEYLAQNSDEVAQVLSNASEGLTATEATTATITSSNELATEVTTLSLADLDIVAKFYSNSVFVGDSIMSGFATFASTDDAPKWLKESIFLAKISWGINSALNESGGPMYMGKNQDIFTSLAQIQPERVFINLGINEMNGLGSPGYSIEKLNGRYGELVANIKMEIPESEIYILNITPCTKEKETPNFKNSTINEFNATLAESAVEWGVNYIDLNSQFGEYLDIDLTTDKFVHHNSKSYIGKWIPFLQSLALNNNDI